MYRLNNHVRFFRVPSVHHWRSTLDWPLARPSTTVWGPAWRTYGFIRSQRCDTKCHRRTHIRRSLASHVFVSLTGLCPLRMGVIVHLLPAFLILLRSPCEFYTRQNRLYVGMLNRFVSFERPFYHFSRKIRSPPKLLQDIARPSRMVTRSQTEPQSIGSDLGHTNVPSRMTLRSVQLIFFPNQ